MTNDSKIVGIDGKAVPQEVIEKVKRVPQNWTFVMKKDGTLLNLTGFLTISPMFIGVVDGEQNLLVAVPYAEFEVVGLASALTPPTDGGTPDVITNDDGTKSYALKAEPGVIGVELPQAA